MSYKKLPWKTSVESYTPSLAGAPTISASAGKYFVDENGIMHVNGYASVTAAGSATQVTLNIPGGYQIDTDRLASGTSTDNAVAVTIKGVFEWFDAGAAYKMLGAFYASSTTIALHENPGLFLASSLADAGTDGVKWNFEIPVK